MGGSSKINNVLFSHKKDHARSVGSFRWFTIVDYEPQGKFLERYVGMEVGGQKKKPL
jgi:hypothetical protein